MERKNLTDCISQQTLEQLTEEAFGAPAKKRTGFSRGLALAACLALVVMAVNLDTVYAAVQKLLYFLPGSGGVSEEAPQDYWLPREEYTAVTPQGEYVVSYLYRRGDTLALGVKKTVPGFPMPEDSRGAASQPENGPESRPAGNIPPDGSTGRLTIDFLDPAGNPVKVENSERGSFAIYDENGAIFEEEREIAGFDLERFTLLLDGEVELPVELRRVDPADYSMGSALTARDAGYVLSLLPLNRNCTRFAVVTAPEDPQNAPAGSYWTPVTFGMTAVGESGKGYQPESVNSHPGCQEFYIPELPEERITAITVTEVLESTRYEKPQASVRLPALELGEKVELNQEVSLWNYTLTVQAAELTQDGELRVQFRWEGQKGDRWLNQVDLEWPETSQQHPTGRNSIDSSSYTTGSTGMEGRAGKKTTLPVTFVSVVQKGRWEFHLERAE